MRGGRFLRAALGASAAILCAAAAAPAAPAANSGDRPNVVVIETDDQTQESVRVMDSVNNLMADKGTTFTNSFVSFSLCCPSRATFLTGQYSHNNGVQGNVPPAGGYPKLDSTNTLAVWLQQSGYYTALIGKYLNQYGNGKPPSNKPTAIPPGWTEWHGSVDPTTYRYYGYRLNENGTLKTYGADRAPGGYQTDVYTSKATELIKRRASSDQPFFLWTTYLAPHSGAGEDEPDDPNNLRTPIPAPRYKNAFADEDVRTDDSYNEADVSDKPAYVRNRPRLGQRRRAAIRENYQQRLETLLAADDGVKAILKALKASGELDNTLVIFTSDNGFFHGEHRIPNGKIWPYEPSIRVPLVMRGPGVPRGERRDQLVANVDLAPTILDVTGAKPGRVVDGRSLMPLAGNEEIELGRDILLENGPLRAGAMPGTGAPRYRGLRTPRFVYLAYDTGEKELYDLEKDPSQLTNVATDPSYARIRDLLAARLERLRNCAGSACVDRPSLALRVSYKRDTDRKGRTCAAGDVRLKLSGGDAGRVDGADLFADGRKVSDADDSTLVLLVRRSELDSGAASTLRVRAQTDDDRALTLPAHVRVCS